MFKCAVLGCVSARTVFGIAPVVLAAAVFNADALLCVVDVICGLVSTDDISVFFDIDMVFVSVEFSFVVDGITIASDLLASKLSRWSTTCVTFLFPTVE